MIVNQKFTIVPFSSSLQEEVLKILKEGPIDGPDLLRIVSLSMPATKQGLYKALRNLLVAEIIIKEGGFYLLNKVWLARLNDFINVSEKNLGVSLPFSKTSLNKRQTITFKNAHALDIYWGHLYLALSETCKDKPFFFFNHHNWSMLHRPLSETYLYQTSLKSSHKVMVTLGVNTTIAQKYKKDFSKNNIQIAIDERITVPKTDSVCIIDNFFIVTRYDFKTMNQINMLLSATILFGEKEKKELHKILLNCKNPKIIIFKNNHKANIWKHRLAKNFVIKNSEL